MYLLSRLVLISTLICASHAKTVIYNLKIAPYTANITGQNIKTIAINGGIPGPTLTATVGDTLEIKVTNHLNEDTSLHWHGVLLPNNQDGVPYLNTPPIKPGKSYTFKYPITHHGTYWYHSHSGLQEQKGIYGALVFHPKKGERIKTDLEKVLVLSDWNDENPDHVMANIKKDGDYYSLKKGTTQSWLGAMQNGWQAIKNRINGVFTRMGAMDISDIGYDAFVINGKKQGYFDVRAGKTVRLRLVNAAASSYLNIEFAGGPMLIVASDGVDVEPIKVKRLRISPAETYDVIVTVPDHKSYELRSTSEDGTGYASLFIGKGEKIFAPDIVKPNMYVMGHSNMSGPGMANMGQATDTKMDQQKMSPASKKEPYMHGSMSNHTMMGSSMEKPIPSKMPVIAYMNNYQHLKAIHDTTLPAAHPRREVKLNLTGNMERYVWSFNKKIFSEDAVISIKKGEVVSFILTNKTMMNHPIHLHGHFFRLINGQGAKSPLKHTVNIGPMETVTIEFDANERGDWFFHCHNLYHMKGGMARIISYEGSSKVTPTMVNNLDHDSWFYKGELTILSNEASGLGRMSDSYNAFEIEYNSNYKREYDVDINYLRSLTRFLDFSIGVQHGRDDADEKAQTKGLIGVHYVLPFLIDTSLTIDTKGKFIFKAKSSLQISERLTFDWEWQNRNIYSFGFNIEITKTLLLTGVYDSSRRFGAGVKLRF